ncbi:hypothetical protein [Actinoplanes sp. NPDC023714]|uniref:hypothetical protein n=1 Tax=Actinoplanes sp. NPDC023714 TaxID=3154322 RepID=UPI0033CECAEC
MKKIAAAAAGLGLLAFAADDVDAAAGRLLTVLVSSGLAWGLAAYLAATLIQVVLPLAVLARLAHVQRLWRSWPLLLIATIATATVSALLWQVLRDAANRFG